MTPPTPARAVVTAVWLLALVCLSSAQAQNVEPPRADRGRVALREARHRFEQADYASTRALLQPLLDGNALEDVADRNEALRLYGVASFLEGRRGDAEGSFWALLVYDPGARLDAALYPPEVVEFYETIRARREAEMAAAVQRAPQKKNLLVAFLPFGVGQFQNGDRAKGIVLLATEVALVGVTIATYALFKNNEGASHTFADPGGARTLQKANIVSGILLGGVAAYGVIDALWNYRREPTTEATLTIGVDPRSASAIIGAHGRF